MNAKERNYLSRLMLGDALGDFADFMNDEFLDRLNLDIGMKFKPLRLIDDDAEERKPQVESVKTGYKK